MTVGEQVFSGEGAREEAARALVAPCCRAGTTTRRASAPLSRDSKS
jgi:hypothetical protein